MTDDSSTEKGALKATWPHATQLLCVFHFLQRRWTWLWEAKNKIHNNDRRPLIQLVKTMVYTSTEEKLTKCYKELPKHTIASKYPNFIKHMEALWPHRKEWALCYRQGIVIRGNHTNNVSEAGIKILKELIFSRIKAFNLVQILHFVTEALELYYQRKLLSVAHNRLDHYVSLKFLGKNAERISKNAITPLPDYNNQFSVQSRQDSDTTYLVDMSLGTCTCPAGRDGSLCSHQHSVILHFQKASLNYIPTLHPAARQQLAFITLGDKAEKSLKFYASVGRSMMKHNIPRELRMLLVHPTFLLLVGPSFMMVQRMNHQRPKKSKPISCKSFQQNLMRW